MIRNLLLPVMLVSAAACTHVVRVGELKTGPEPAAIAYRKVNGQDVAMRIFEPAGHKPSHHRAAVIILHGGDWLTGDVQSAFPIARYFAARGAVAFCVDYRIVKPQGPTVFDSLADCKSAVRYVRNNAGRLGVDSARIAVFGDSAGAHLAACLASIAEFDPPDEDRSVSSAPNAAVLVNPFIDTTDFARLAKLPGVKELVPDKDGGPLPTLLGYGQMPDDRAHAISPYHHIKLGQPPTLLIHSAASDMQTVYDTRRLAQTMQAAEIRCKLHVVQGVAHPLERARVEVYIETLRASDRFLASLGFLDGEPTLVADPPGTPASH